MIRDALNQILIRFAHVLGVFSWFNFNSCHGMYLKKRKKKRNKYAVDIPVFFIINACISFSVALNFFQIIVATPGRLLDHIENKGGLSVHLMGLKVLILDEADHLLDLGFRKDMEKILDCLPRQRQSLLFSATIPKEVRFFLLFLLMGQTSS
jgi:hypothetical protein